jgi:hypothetical protein
MFGEFRPNCSFSIASAIFDASCLINEEFSANSVQENDLHIAWAPRPEPLSEYTVNIQCV